MAQRRRLGKKLFKSLLPILLLLVAALVLAMGFIVQGITRPTRQPYLVTPQSFSAISGSALKVKDETWTNRDGTQARGWMLRGSEGAPAVIFLHRYGGDRSWLFNLGIKLNETSNFTILWVDLRGHGMNPQVEWSSFGNFEEADLLDALAFIRTVKSAGQNSLVGQRIGVYGVELGAYTALRAASQDPTIKVLVLDSVPGSADALVNSAVNSELGVSAAVVLSLARLGVRGYFFGNYANKTSCEVAAALKTQQALLLAGADDGPLRESTSALKPCFPNQDNLKMKTDLPLTGFTVSSATGEQGEAYDRPVIDFFIEKLP